jgi:Zn-dependent protease
MEFIFLIFVLVFSIVIHEVAHGYAAKAQGDRTAEYEGRLTLNPLVHLDPIGSALVPFSLYAVAVISGAPPLIFGWAKPVPYNPFALRNFRWGPVLVALAGPASNFSLAILFGALAQFITGAFGYEMPALALLGLIIQINILLGIFNLLPIPPLDGSKLLFAVLPDSLADFKIFLETYGFVLLLMFIFLGGLSFLMPLIDAAFHAVSGGVFLR